nr:unnamed protein product [Callosobruchus chinensis]
MELLKLGRPLKEKKKKSLKHLLAQEFGKEGEAAFILVAEVTWVVTLFLQICVSSKFEEVTEVLDDGLPDPIPGSSHSICDSLAPMTSLQPEPDGLLEI